MVKWHNNELAQFASELTLAWEAYGRELKPKTAATMADFLQKKGVQASEAIAAIEAITNVKDTPPTAVDILHAITGDPKNFGKRAWETVLEAIGRIGLRKNVRFKDPITNATLKALVGEWAGLQKHNNPKDLVWLGKDFERAYNDFVVRGKVPHVDYLAGLDELENARSGYLEDIKKRFPEMFTVHEIGPACPVRALAIEQPKAIEHNRPKQLAEATQKALEGRTL